MKAYRRYTRSSLLERARGPLVAVSSGTSGAVHARACADYRTLSQVVFIAVFLFPNLGESGSWEFKRQAWDIFGVGNVGALPSRTAWELGGRVGTQQKSFGVIGLSGLLAPFTRQRAATVVYTGTVSSTSNPLLLLPFVDASLPARADATADATHVLHMRTAAVSARDRSFAA